MMSHLDERGIKEGLRFDNLLTRQILVELKHIGIFIPLPQVCVLVEIGHA